MIIMIEHIYDQGDDIYEYMIMINNIKEFEHVIVIDERMIMLWFLILVEEIHDKSLTDFLILFFIY